MRAQSRLFRPVATRFALSAAVLALAAPLCLTLSLTGAAHASPGGFSLPTATPTPTSRPDVEGPADDTGVVPLAPRVIPTDTPTPAPSVAPTTTPTDGATPSASPTITPILNPSDTVTPLPTQTAPATRAGQPATATNSPPPQRPGAGSAGAPAAPATAPPAAQTGDAADTGTPGLDTSGGLPLSETEQAPEIAQTADEASTAIPLWAWIAGGLALLSLLIGAAFFMRRRTELPVPEIERPKVAPRPAPAPTSAPTEPARPMATPAPQAAPPITSAIEPETETVPGAPARIDLEIEIVRATRSVMNFTLDYRLNLANRTPNAVRDVSVAAILTSAQSGAAPAGGDMGFARPEPLMIPRIGPNKTHSESGQVQLPTAKLQVMHQGNVPLFVPLLQITVTQGQGEPLTRHYVVGQPSASSTARLQPIPLNTPPGGIPGLRVRELDIQPA